MVRDSAKKMWLLMGQVSKAEGLSHTTKLSIPHLPFCPSVKLNSFSSVGQCQVLILLGCPSGLYCPYLFETLYRNPDYRHLRSYTYTRAKACGRWGPRVSPAPGGVGGGRLSMVNIRRRAGKGDNGGVGRPVHRGTGRLIDRRISGRVEDGRDERGGARVLPGAAAGAGGMVAGAR